MRGADFNHEFVFTTVGLDELVAASLPLPSIRK